MVNSSSIGCEEDENRKASCVQVNSFHTESQSSSPITASSATQSRNDFIRSIDINLPCKADAVEPTPSKTDLDVNINNVYKAEHLSKRSRKEENDEMKKSFFCSVPLEKVQTVLSEKNSSLKYEGNGVKVARKVLCLYCDRTFVNVNLRQKHTERCHSSKQLRRVSLRKHQNCFTSTPCIYCDKFTSSSHTLKELFEHLIFNHSNKYFGCLLCEDRYFNFSHLTDHNALYHNGKTLKQKTNCSDTTDHDSIQSVNKEVTEEISSVKNRGKGEVKTDNKSLALNSTKIPESSETNNEEEQKVPVKNLRSKKLAVKSSRMIIKRSKRLQAKLNESYKKKRIKDIDRRNKNNKHEQIISTKLNEKSTKINQNSVNPYPEFDSFFQVKKITDHSIDNLKISSLTFDDVFDKAFFNRIKCNIQENLLHHIDGKLFKNEASESRISNFEKISNVSQETQNVNSENYGCEISLNAITPTTSLLSSSQFGEDPESQIEYGSKASKKKIQIKKDEGHYKYFTRRKYQASILEHKENRDLSKLDIWTQYIIKNRQQKILDDKKSPKEILDYFSGEEYKNKMKREELNRILDRRGPFEDLREEVSKKAALDKLNGENESYLIDDSLMEVGELLNDILNKVFELSSETTSSFQNSSKNGFQCEENRTSEIPSYLNLRPASSALFDNEIDKSDRIALICSSQETENFEHPNNTVRDKNEKVELTGEWARSRIFVCAACGIKLQNIKQFLEHRSASHQYVWVQHYEFVGNQSELYQHLSIPVLGKVGVLEGTVQCKVWKRSDARLCTKCGKQCNSLGELHRHILECGGDWTWMLARKKCKYRPFGAKSRRKRRGLVKRIYTQKTEPSEKKSYKKSFDIPRQKPSDADTIQRMLANLPPKRITRKIICLKEGFKTTRSKQTKTKTKQSKFKCGKLIRGKGKEQNKSNNIAKYKRTNENKKDNYRRSLRCLNKVLTSRILDTNSSLIVRRKYKKKINNHKKKEANKKDVFFNKSHKEPLTQTIKKPVKTDCSKMCVNNENEVKEEVKSKRSSPRIEKRSEYNCLHKTLIDKMNIKRFFPVKKNTKNAQNKTTDENKQDLKPKNAKINCSASKGKQVMKDDTEKTDENSYCAINKDHLCLRKRKLKSENTENFLPHKTRQKKNGPSTKNNCEISKRRKQKNCQKIVAEENVTANSDSSEIPQQENKANEENTQISSKNLEEPSPTLLKIVDETEPVLNLEEKIVEERAKSASPVKCEINSEEQQCTKNLTVVPNNSITVSTPSERLKKKIKRPSRGLNDCIAMLTSKLEKSIEDSSIENGSSHVSQENTTTSLNSEYVLKVPLFNEHFQLYSKKEQNEVLNILNDSEEANKLNVPKQNNETLVKQTVENIDADSRTPDCNNHTNIVPQEIVSEIDSLHDAVKQASLRKSDIRLKQKDHKPDNKELSNCNMSKENNNLTPKSNFMLKNNKACNEVKTSLHKKRKQKTQNSQTATDKNSIQKRKLRKIDKEKEEEEEEPMNLTSQEEKCFQETVTLDEHHCTLFKEPEPVFDNRQMEIEECKIPSVEVGRKIDTDSEDEIPLSALVKDNRWHSEKSEDTQNYLSVEEIQNELKKTTAIDDSIEKNTHNDKIDMSNNNTTFEHEVTLEIDCENMKDKLLETEEHTNFNQLDNDKHGSSYAKENKPDKMSVEASIHGLKECKNSVEIRKNRFDVSISLTYVQNCTLVEETIDQNFERQNNENEIEMKDSFTSSIVDSVGELLVTQERNIALPCSKQNEELPELLHDLGVDEKVIAEKSSISQTDISESKYQKTSTDGLSNDYSILDNENKFIFNNEDIVIRRASSNSNESITEVNDSKEVNGNFQHTKVYDTSETDATESIIQKENENDESQVVAENNFSELIVSNNEVTVEKALISSDAPSSVQTEKSRDNVFTGTLEAKVDHKLASNNEDSLKDDTISNNSSTCNNLVNDGDKEKEVKELRRSKRNSKRIASYNEIDLVDPLLDEIDGNISDIIKDTTQAFYVNKTKNRKKNKADPKVAKPSGEELFDLLKSTTNENILPKPPANSFLHHFDDISNDFNDDNFDILGDILEKSMAVIEKDLTEKTIVNMTTEALEISENNSNEVISNSNVKTQFSFKSRNVANKSKGKKKSKKNSKHQQKMLGKEIENRLANQQEVSENMSMEFLEKNGMEDSNKTVEIDSNKKSDTDKNKAHYCEICDKFFCRLEGLTKHKRTLTHISKLSEIEAREASLKSKDSQLKDREPETDEIISEAKKDLSLLNILKTVDTNEGKTGSPRYTMNIGDSHIKLTDIINDVLNKPVLKNSCPENTFSNILTQNDTSSEVKRYRSLAERKSFESDHCPDITKGDSNMKTIDCFEPEITNAAGTILERQISLLENIIENRSALSYIDELSISSTQSLNENTSVDGELIKYRNENAPVPTFCKQNDVKLSSKEEFLRPSQYEEISEDSIHRNSEEQRSRKILNRDEELFLECCSLLKSGSEVSSYSKNSARITKDFSNLVEEKRFNRVEVLEPSNLSRKEDSSSDNSIVTTTLDDNFSPDESNSVTISSDWNVKHTSTAVKNTDFKTKDFTFEKIFNSTILPEERLPTVDDATSEDFTAQLTVPSDQVENGSNISSPETSGNCFDGKSSEEFNNMLNIENRKILTKGAMKEFEGLKVSIPTEDLNMAKILTSNPPVKMHLSDNNEDYSEKNETRFISSRTSSRSESRSTSKTKKKHSPKPPQTKKMSTLTKSSKIHDIYDFEETQDNSDIFTKPNFRSFRSNSEKSKRIDLFEESDNESGDYVDTVSFDAFSSSTSSVSEMVPRKSKTQQNITKKKCMIMGRIFKNAAKSRSIDENIRNIPVIDNTKLVEDFVLSCPEPSLSNTEVKPTMTEEEMNAAFDSLLNSGNTPAKPINSEVLSNEKSANKNSCNKKKSKSKNRKRSYWHSDSSDDEFKLQTSSNKRVKNKNNTTGDSCINLEQELKECIGVASRKSQRKCTSGKQNVLIEYWSSDESLFEPAQEYPSLKPAVDNELTKVSKTSEIMYEKISVADVSNKERSVSQELKKSTSNSSCNSNRRKRAAVNPLYHWSSSSEDESHDLIEIKPVRDEFEDDDERPVQHGWIVGDSPKKLVTMLAQAKGKKCETEGVKEHGKKRTNALS